MKRAARLLLPVLLIAGGAWTWTHGVHRGGGPDVADVPTFATAEGPFTRMVNAEGLLKAEHTTVISAPTEGHEAMMIAWMLDDGDPVKKGDVVIRFDSGEATRRLADGDSDRAAAEGQIAKERTLAETTLHDRDRTATLTTEELKNTKELGKKDPRFFPRSEVIESEIDEGLYQSRLDHARTARKIEEKLNRSKLQLLSIQQRKAELLHQQARAAMRQLEIRAPHDGTFVLQRWGIRGMLRAGDRVYPGMRIAEISTADRMDAEVYVLEADAGGLAVGRTATVVLEAQPDVVWKARVKKVDPFPKPRQPEVPAQYFATLLQLEGKSGGLKPGQRLHSSIVLDELPRALAVPRQAVFRRDNDSIVYRRSGGRFEPVKVKLGPGTVGRLVIADGLRAGDEIALRDPALSADEAVSASGRNGSGGRSGPSAPSGPSLPGGGARRK
jgi:RND family efflux transporter MFP subunit